MGSSLLLLTLLYGAPGAVKCTPTDTSNTHVLRIYWRFISMTVDETVKISH